MARLAAAGHRCEWVAGRRPGRLPQTPEPRRRYISRDVPIYACWPSTPVDCPSVAPGRTPTLATEATCGNCIVPIQTTLFPHQPLRFPAGKLFGFARQKILIPGEDELEELRDGFDPR